MILTGTHVDNVSNSDSDEETNQLIFGSGFGGISNRDIGADGYLYVILFGKYMINIQLIFLFNK